MKKLYSVLIPFLVSQNLIWNANSEIDLAGYKVYWGNQSRVYQFVADNGNETSFDLSLFSDPTFFAVTAYDTAGNESGFSEEVFFSPQQTERKPVKPRAFSINGVFSSDPNSGGSSDDTVFVAPNDTLMLSFIVSNLLTDSSRVPQDSIFWNAHISQGTPNQFTPLFENPIPVLSQDTTWRAITITDSLIFVTVNSSMIDIEYVVSESVWWIPVVIKSMAEGILERKIVVGVPLK